MPVPGALMPVVSAGDAVPARPTCLVVPHAMPNSRDGLAPLFGERAEWACMHQYCAAAPLQCPILHNFLGALTLSLPEATGILMSACIPTRR